MNEPTIETLARRLNRLEHENRRLKRTGVDLVDQFSGSFTRERMRSNCTYPLFYADSSMSFINEAENIRHIVIHNGGRISQEFISRTRRSDVAVGEIVPLSSDLLEKVYHESRVLSSAIMKSVAKKFFNVQDSDLPVVIS